MTAADKRIHGDGTSYDRWQSAFSSTRMQEIDIEALFASARRFVLVSPHPDDEVIAFGGFLQRILHEGIPLLLVSVTNGEACYPESNRWPVGLMGKIRITETETALFRLGWKKESYEWKIVGLPDTAVERQATRLLACLTDCLQHGDIVLTTWREDGHCDHESVGRICAEAAAERGLTLLEAPVWAFHWGEPDDTRMPWPQMRKFRLEPLQQMIKLRALQAFSSQLAGDPDRNIPPILTPGILKRACLPYEVMVA